MHVMIAEEMRDIVFLELERVADTDLLRRQVLRQELIVITAAATDTVTMVVKHHAGDKHQVDRTFPSRRLGFGNAQTTLTHHVLAVIGTDLHRITMGDREKESFLILILGE